MSYSYSKISLYEKCPKKFYFKYIEKLTVPFENKPVFDKGKFIHHIIEHYPELPEYKFQFKEVEDKKLDYLHQINDFIRNNKMMSFLLSKDVLLHREKEFFLDNSLKEIEKIDGSLINGIIDYIGQYNDNILIVDWKTGMSQKYASLDQLKFYSLYIFNNFPNISKLKIFLFFIEQDVYVYEELTRDVYKKIKEKYLKIIDDIKNDTVYKCNKSENCINCEFYSQCSPFKVRTNFS